MPTKWPITQSQVASVELNITQFAGLNTNTTASQIDDNQSPDMLNITLDARGRPDKRFGYQRVYSDSLGPGKINGAYNFVKKDGTTRFLIHWGTNLYTQTGTAQPVSIFAGMANNRSVFFTFNDFCWIKDGTNYLRYDGTTVVTVQSIAYVPTLFISTPPSGGGTANENVNLLTPAFKQSFSGNGTAKDFQLAATGLDATLISAVVNGVTIAEGAALSVNRSTGLCTFTTVPTTGTNNVIITAYKTIATNANIVLQSIDHVIFGGANDTRVHWYGNPNFPNRVQRSGLNDPSYAPDLGFVNVGSDSSQVVKMVAQYDTCIILKGPLRNAVTTAQNVNENIIYQMTFQLNAGVVSFPVTPLNNQIECIAVDGVQLINNTPTWLSSQGIHQLVGSNVKDERNTVHISTEIDYSADYNLIGLLESTNLANSVSVDFDNKYILAIQDESNTAFVYDYILNVWLKWDNIKASCFVVKDNYLYFGDNTTGLMHKMLKLTDVGNFRDDGMAINAYWRSKRTNFEQSSVLKTAPRMWFHLKPALQASVDLSYITDNFNSPAGTFVTEYLNQFDYSLWDYANFTYLLSGFPQTIQTKLKAKKFMYLQITLSNPRIDESMGILLVRVSSQIVKMAK